MKAVGGHGWGSGIAEPAQRRRRAPRLPRPGQGDATGTDACPGRSRGAGVRRKRPGAPSPLPASHPVLGPAVTPGSEQKRAGRAARASPPRRYRAPPPRQRAEFPERNGAGHGRCPPSRTERARAAARGGAASPSRRVSASRRAPCPPSCLSPRPALAAAERAPIPPSPRAEGAKPMAEPPMAPPVPPSPRGRAAPSAGSARPAQAATGNGADSPWSNPKCYIPQ